MTGELQLMTILACPACGFDDSETTAAANLAIGVMIAFVFAVLSCFLSFIWKMAKAERNLTPIRVKADVQHPSPTRSDS